MISAKEMDELITIYRDGLLDDTLPFWIKHCIDHEQGGFIFCLDRDGSALCTDKCMWTQGRFTWLLATLYIYVEQKQKWLELARHGIDFITKYGFDSDGRMFFWVTRDGQPLRKRRYLATESFGTIALAAYAKAAKDEQKAQQALDLFKLMLKYHTTEGLLEPKLIPQTRRMKGLTMPMILITTAQVLRDVTGEAICNKWIDRCVDEIERDFMKEQFQVVLENVGPNGEFIDTFDGRLVTPGHSIEAAWFILHESKHRGGDRRLQQIGLKILDWSWKAGWDDEYGGIIYYRDAKSLPCTEYWHDMKFWWPQNEAIIATLLAYQITGDDKYARWHRMAHDWAYKYFPDPEYGEWFGYLHRDGRISTRLKGNMWKGPFHLPRMQWYCWKLLERMKKNM